MRGKSEDAKIERPVAIAVEGADYYHTLIRIAKTSPGFDRVQLWNFSLVGEPERWLEVFRLLPGYDSVIRAIGFIRDAEDDATARERELKRAFAKCGLSEPPASQMITAGHPLTGFLIIPHGKQQGCLEHAVLEAATGNPAYTCAQGFQECVNQPTRNENWRAKVRVHAMIAASEQPQLTLGQSMDLALWDKKHPSITVMTEFITALAAACKTAE
jgi:hypothetical protein